MIVFCSIGTDSSISDKTRFPTTITCPPLNQPVLLQAYRKFLARYHWTNAFVLCDDNKKKSYVLTTCRNILKPNALPGVQIASARFNSADAAGINYDHLLDYASRSARGLLHLYLHMHSLLKLCSIVLKQSIVYNNLFI